MPEAVPECPVTTVKHSSGERWPCGVAEGWSMYWWSVLQMEQVTSTRLFWGKTMPHVPMTEKNGMPYTSAVASPTVGAAAPRHSGSS